MISRYTPSDFADLWSENTKYKTWLQVELAACEAMEKCGYVPIGTAKSIEEMDLQLDPARIAEIEEDTRHDVVAFLVHVQELAGPPAQFLHKGMTSSDVVDTGLALTLSKAMDSLVVRASHLCFELRQKAFEHKHTVMVGRSHGMAAQPTTMGVVLAGHLEEFRRSVARLDSALKEIRVGKMSGVVGTYAHLSPEVEKLAMEKLGLSPETVSTQVVARDRHAVVACAIALCASAVERLATSVRHWARGEVREVREPFLRGQRGSSAMPHKMNPIVSENLCGLARTVRAIVTPALENVCLWHERDISHSSVERIIFPDATSTLAYMLDRLAWLVSGLQVFPENMKKNLDATGELVFSEAVMLALVDRGWDRQLAWSTVHEAASASIRGGGTFRQNLENDDKISPALNRQEIEKIFDLDWALRHVCAIFDRI